MSKKFCFRLSKSSGFVMHWNFTYFETIPDTSEKEFKITKRIINTQHSPRIVNINIIFFINCLDTAQRICNSLIQKSAEPLCKKYIANFIEQRHRLSAKRINEAASFNEFKLTIG